MSRNCDRIPVENLHKLPGWIIARANALLSSNSATFRSNWFKPFIKKNSIKQAIMRVLFDDRYNWFQPQKELKQQKLTSKSTGSSVDFSGGVSSNFSGWGSSCASTCSSLPFSAASTCSSFSSGTGSLGVSGSCSVSLYSYQTTMTNSIEATSTQLQARFQPYWLRE